MNRTSMFQHIVILVICGLLLSACAAAHASPHRHSNTPIHHSSNRHDTPHSHIYPPFPFVPPAEGRIIFIKPDKRKFAGMVYGQGKTAIILEDMWMAAKINGPRLSKHSTSKNSRRSLTCACKAIHRAFLRRSTSSCKACVMPVISASSASARTWAYCLASNISDAPELVGAVPDWRTRPSL